jgi:hypothetical protein
LRASAAGPLYAQIRQVGRFASSPPLLLPMPD